MSFWFWNYCDKYYSKDKDGNIYRTEEDEVIEMLTEEQIKTWYSSYVSYIDNFMRVSNVRRNLF